MCQVVQAAFSHFNQEQLVYIYVYITSNHNRLEVPTTWCPCVLLLSIFSDASCLKSGISIVHCGTAVGVCMYMTVLQIIAGASVAYRGRDVHTSRIATKLCQSESIFCSFLFLFPKRLQQLFLLITFLYEKYNSFLPNVN